ncbi:MAG: T9SS type A sorting domain-containing protein, partial [Bacteroidales bacterium]
GTGSDFTFLGYLGRVNYTWKDRYIFTGTARLDGSSRFSEEKRYANYFILEGTKKTDFPLTYAIYNSNGIKVLTGKTTNNRIEFNGKLNNGLYILELYTDTETIRKKIQIQKN